MKRLYPLLCLLALSASVDAQRTSSITVDSLLNVLDKEIAHADYYMQIRERKIDSIKTIHYQIPTVAEPAIQIANLYAPYQCDSALVWYERAKALSGENWSSENEMYYERCKGRKTGYNIPFDYDTICTEELSQQYAVNACYSGMKYIERGDTIRGLEMLTRSALTDLRLGITDNASIWLLAQEIYRKGQVERAYEYIEYSCANSDIYNAQLRYVQIGPVAHGIAKTYKQWITAISCWLKRATITLTIVLILLIACTIYSVRQNKKLHRLNRILKCAKKEQEEFNKQLDSINKQLSEMNRIREQYICVYLEEKSGNIRKQYKESLKAGKVDSEEKFKEQLDKYYKSFDTTFLRLFPDFVERFNSLLKLNSQINPPAGSLTPELRIFALVRLGITRSTQISELLCLSNNTVYCYRSRVRSLAINEKEEFEVLVRNL